MFNFVFISNVVFIIVFMLKLVISLFVVLIFGVVVLEVSFIYVYCEKVVFKIVIDLNKKIVIIIFNIGNGEVMIFNDNFGCYVKMVFIIVIFCFFFFKIC